LLPPANVQIHQANLSSQLSLLTAIENLFSLGGKSNPVDLECQPKSLSLISGVTLGASQASVSYVLMLFDAASQYTALFRK